jgi:ribosome-associated translation inhibitor RaiA
MKLPLQISFKNMERDEQITELIKDKIAKCDRLSSEIIQCHVTVAVPHRSHRTGNFYDVTIDLSLPGKEIVYSHESQDEIENKDIRHVLKVAFDAIYRQIEDYNRMRTDAA